MTKIRKTDKARLREKRGQGYGLEYKPWILPHEVPSDGRCHKILGWKHNRVHYLLSDGELWAFLILQMQDNVLDIREQFPLLPINETLEIAERLNVLHPPKYKINREEKTVLTSDFNILVKCDIGVKEIVRTLKTEEDYQKRRTQEKLLIEKEFWSKKGIDWGVITHNEESKVIGRNIYSIYQDYFWNDAMNLNDIELKWLIEKFKDMLSKSNMNVIKTTSEFERVMGWCEGEGLSFLKYLLTHKEVKANFRKKFNYYDMDVWL
ncbi:TnsA endonuclease N-terminal domain-containing protein [Clostridium sp. 'White wine YQ']|uniref:TnsA endonuclease N-terminal domain-containing protein n=1 Tax=Clostridium sp. 'White wine YQ' TaxID=3027474 RepID=UPI002365E451|nr:TnsA endonuclease N-terminal domain-containing protein [Clostridium sp. 'White wine YQ']MDD7795902.1 TnsA endonuclease N-terminal domain-containing protein [Clostridium sp. 'White wine YQ']